MEYVENWDDKATQCQNCKSFQVKEDKYACVPEDMSFENALTEYGEASLVGHCDSFEAK